MRALPGLSLLLGVIACMGFVAPVAAAATLRGIVQIRGSTVRLSDLFAGLETGQDCALGDAPAPGTRLVLQQPQLEAIASQFGVSWEPVGSDQTVTLDRVGRTVERATVISMLKTALAKQYGTNKIVVTLPSYQVETVDLDARIDIGELSTEEEGLFAAVLTASLGGQETLRVAVSGRVDRLLTVAVPARPIAPGEIITSQDLSSVDISAARVRGAALDDVGEAVGLISVRPLPVGLPISRSDLRHPNIVFRGGPVLMRLESGGIDVEAQGQALESGALADQVRVLNPISRAVLLATVSGENEVQIDALSQPFGQERFGSAGRSRLSVLGGSDDSQYARSASFGGGEP